MGILVFDVGTSSMRGVLMNEQADILCQFQEKYHPDFHLSIYVTQNPEIWRRYYRILRRTFRYGVRNMDTKLR